jgi:hypothetical protein
LFELPAELSFAACGQDKLQVEHLPGISGERYPRDGFVRASELRPHTRARLVQAHEAIFGFRLDLGLHPE